MAKRKKQEFRPDRSRTGLLSKLYLTRKQRQTLLRWVLFSLVLVVLSVVQDTVLWRYRLFGAATDLVPCGILMICVLMGTETTAMFALVSSALYVFSSDSAGTYVIPLLTFLGVGVTIFRQSFLRKGFSATVICTVGSLTLYELVVFVVSVFQGLTTSARLIGFAVTTGLTLVAVPILYPILVSIGKIGGETWKE